VAKTPNAFFRRLLEPSPEVISMLVLALSMMVAQAGPCADDEVRVLSCLAKKKQLAVCAGPSSSPTWLQYRFGPPGRPELVFPRDVARGFAPFSFAEQTLATGTAKTLTFTSDGTSYEVWTQDGKDGGMGVNVSQGGKVVATVACTDAIADNLDAIVGRLGTAAGTGTGTGSAGGSTRPDPLAGRSQKDICNDDALLLLKYSYDDLSSNDGFKKKCCTRGALGDDDRCQLDWPSSDVPLCSNVDLWRNQLFALYGYTFKDPKFQKYFGAMPWYKPRADFDPSWMPAVAHDNVARLKTLVKKGGCVADEPTSTTSTTSTTDACAQAGIAWSLALQKGANGQMDGVQQSEIADAIRARCNGDGWAADATACFVAGRANACLSSLSQQQQKSVWSDVKAICPDVRDAAGR
jgi:hypothetical protein